jgi:anti-sigma-K factor RskA
VVVLSIVLASARQQLDSARAQSQAIAAVLAAPDVQAVRGPVTTGGVTTVVLSADRQELVVTTSGLAALPAGKTYELWLIGPSPAKPSAIRPAGLLPAAVAGRTPPVLAAGLVTGDKLGLTVEPAGGSSQPTTTPVLLLSLPVST